MNSSATAASVSPVAPNYQYESIRHLPAAARAAFARFQVIGDPAALDPVLLAILEDFIPKTPARPLAELPGGTRLIDDLGFDSLALTEVVFFTEDLFGITITNEEIIRVRTLDDLRGFIHDKVSILPAR
ncbi:acyl carrier protein [Opitutus sp. GAS368]|uniref:acyl carrier protein n=1 Tax=Opitutus sp. GAS368 TaxID=1882749 RepID=UPI00087C780C|nr:acyl carrier protein [Opitutus sp. GAS368]SDS13624.1 Phosphopantetheine attachment site [Opitutus sp. GAS368]